MKSFWMREMTKICPKCLKKTENKEDKYCSRCGVELAPYKSPQRAGKLYFSNVGVDAVEAQTDWDDHLEDEVYCALEEFMQEVEVGVVVSEGGEVIPKTINGHEVVYDE